MAPGRVVILNGVPRSGKSTVARALQDTDAEPWMALGVDLHQAATPERLRPGIGLRPGGERPDLEGFVERAFFALYDSVAAHARLALNVVVDVGHHDGHAGIVRLWPRCLARLRGLPVLVVGVRCPTDEIMRRRRASGARYLAAAEGEPVPAPVLRWQKAVHRPGHYDLELDTSRASPAECAAAIRAALDRGGFRAAERIMGLGGPDQPRPSDSPQIRGSANSIELPAGSRT